MGCLQCISKYLPTSAFWHVVVGSDTPFVVFQELRVNWAFQKDQREDSASQFQIFVGDLASDVNNKVLCEAFQSCGCSDARVMWDHNTGRSKGYGFVSFK